MTKKGGVTIPVFDCIFHGVESIESFAREFDVGLYQTLPNLYGICLSDNSNGRRKIVAGFSVKTSYTHDDEEFLPAITAAVVSSEKLRPFLGPQTTFLPARLGVVGSAPLSEQEMLRLMATQFLKYAVGGNA